MSAIRVCAITCDCYPNDPLVRRTAEAAMRAGYDYHVICTMEKGQKKYEVFNRVHIHRIAMSRITGKPIEKMFLLWTIFTFLAFWKIARLHFKYKFAVVHAHNMPDFLVFAALIPRLFGAKVILEVQDVSPELMVAKTKGRLRRITFRLAAFQEYIATTFADYVVTVGWPFENLLLKRGVPQKKLCSILNSADPNIFSVEKRTKPFLGEGTAERPLILMYHGTLAKRAGLDTAIRAFVKARAIVPHLNMRFMGSGEMYLPYLKQLAQELGVTNHIAFLPGGPVDDVVDFVTQGDIGIIPYRADGFADLLLPTKAYEYALMQRPMIVSNTTAIRSMFRSESVVLCEPSNVDSFAQAIIDLYQHPEKRAALVENAEQDYIPYRWELMAERYQQLLASLAAKSRKRSDQPENWNISKNNQTLENI